MIVNEQAIAKIAQTAKNDKIGSAPLHHDKVEDV
jgi:hypothetical protein